jgi:hypothetical protein
VYPAGAGRGVRRPDGRLARPLPPAVRPASAAGVHRRDAQAVGQRDPTAAPRSARSTRPVRLRVSAGGRRQLVHGVRTAAGVAGRAGDRPADGPGLRRGPAVAGRRPAPGRRPDRAGDGQPEHPRPGLPIRGARAGAGQADRRAVGVALHPQARVLAERGRVRVGRPVQAVPGPPDLFSGAAPPGGGRLGAGAERAHGRGELAIHHGGRPDQAAAALPIRPGRVRRGQGRSD